MFEQTVSDQSNGWANQMLLLFKYIVCTITCLSREGLGNGNGAPSSPPPSSSSRPLPRLRDDLFFVVLGAGIMVVFTTGRGGNGASHKTWSIVYGDISNDKNMMAYPKEIRRLRFSEDYCKYGPSTFLVRVLSVWHGWWLNPHWPLMVYLLTTICEVEEGIRRGKA